MMIIILSIIGLLLSIYAVHVEKSKERIKNYKPICDVSNKISCTKVFSSEYSHILGIKNSILGIFFYASIIILSILNLNWIILSLLILAVLSSILLAYLQYKLKLFCIICISVYIINFLLLILFVY